MIYLFRHGETEYNAANRLQGWSDSPLTTKGYFQAFKQAIYFFEHLYDKTKKYTCLTSDLPRCVESSRFLSMLSKQNFYPCIALRENCWGIWEGKSTEESDVSSMLTIRQNEGTNYVPDGGESIASLYVRIQQFFDDNRLLHYDGTILIYSHHNAIKAIIAYIMQKPYDVYQSIEHDCIYCVTKNTIKEIQL